MNFPSATIMLLSTALLSLSLSAQSMPIKKPVRALFTMAGYWVSPLILSLIILGERTTLLFHYYNSINRIFIFKSCEEIELNG